MTQTISSQRYTDDEIVEAKLAARDFDVTVSPVFDLGGRSLRVVVDGHHSLAAARIAGVAPRYSEATLQESDRIGLLTAGQIEEFMALEWMDSDWYDVDTDELVW